MRAGATKLRRLTANRRVALANNGRIEFESEGLFEGCIADEPRGEHGFGYDPIFFYPPLGKTSGELERDLKATVSHRGKAFSALRDYLLRGALVR